MIDAQRVIEIHDLILRDEPGLQGGHGIGPVDGALARGHVFNDANKRTALVTALTYLAIQGVDIPRTGFLEDVMVHVAEGTINQELLASILYELAHGDL